MQKVLLDYGDGKMETELPDSAAVVKYGITYQDPLEVDPSEATRKALENPLGMPPLRELAKPGKKAVIAFPDRVKGGAHAKAHRRVCIPLIVEELLKGGIKKEDITLLCAQGLHRKNTLEEWYWYLGKKIVDEFYPSQMTQHDAEDPELLDFGKDEMGNIVQCNSLIAQCDIPIIIGHVQGNPYGGYSGGYKMAVTGLTGWRSIASHHSPQPCTWITFYLPLLIQPCADNQTPKRLQSEPQRASSPLLIKPKCSVLKCLIFADWQHGLNGAITTNTNIPTDYYGILKLDKNRRRCW